MGRCGIPHSTKANGCVHHQSRSRWHAESRRRRIAYSTIPIAAANRLQHAVLHGFDDSPIKFREVVEHARINPLKRRFVEALGPRLDRLSLKLTKTMDEVLDSPHRFKNAQQIALRAQISTLKLYRNFNAAGLRSPGRFVHGAKLLRAVGYFQDPGYSVRDIAKKVGYNDSRIFADHTGDVFGLTPSRVRNHVAPLDAVDRLIT